MRKQHTQKCLWCGRWEGQVERFYPPYHDPGPVSTRGTFRQLSECKIHSYRENDVFRNLEKVTKWPLHFDVLRVCLLARPQLSPHDLRKWLPPSGYTSGKLSVETSGLITQIYQSKDSSIKRHGSLLGRFHWFSSYWRQPALLDTQCWGCGQGQRRSPPWGSFSLESKYLDCATTVI